MRELDRWENECGRVLRPSTVARIRALNRRHRQLDEKLDIELKRPKPCMAQIQYLKREKLYLKDEIRRLTT